MLGKVGPPLGVMLNAGETSAAAKREALVEYVTEGSAWHDAQIAGDENPPVGARLALVLAFIEASGGLGPVDGNRGGRSGGI